MTNHRGENTSGNYGGNRRNVEARILSAARELFFNKGFYATKTAQIAAKAKTSETGVFRVFSNKYEVLMAVYNDCWREVNAQIRDRLTARYSDPRQEIIEMFRIVWSLYDEQPLLMSFIIINTGNTDTLLVARMKHAIISEENLQYVNRIEKLAEECVKNGLAPNGITARALSEALLGISEGVLLGWYLADNAQRGRYPSKIAISEALAVISTLIYGNEIGVQAKSAKA